MMFNLRKSPDRFLIEKADEFSFRISRHWYLRKWTVIVGMMVLTIAFCVVQGYLLPSSKLSSLLRFADGPLVMAIAMSAEMSRRYQRIANASGTVHMGIERFIMPTFLTRWLFVIILVSDLSVAIEDFVRPMHGPGANMIVTGMIFKVVADLMVAVSMFLYASVTFPETKREKKAKLRQLRPSFAEM